VYATDVPSLNDAASNASTVLVPPFSPFYYHGPR
jgi:hypothetical protein